MGYYTDFSLYVENYTDSSKVINSLEKTLIEDEIEKMAVFESGSIDDGYYTGYSKWYDYSKDMCLLSARFPGTLFHLTGRGEDPEDLWEAYFLNGSSQYCPARIIYDAFDPLSLRPTNIDDISNAKYTYQN